MKSPTHLVGHRPSNAPEILGGGTGPGAAAPLLSVFHVFIPLHSLWQGHFSAAFSAAGFTAIFTAIFAVIFAVIFALAAGMAPIFHGLQ